MWNLIFIAVTKNIEHHIERHYEIESDKNYILQQLDIGEEFYEDRLQHCLSISESIEFLDVILEHYGEHESIDDFEYLKERTFTSFFRDNSIDVPRCFTKTKSVRRSINQIDLLKLNNYLMRDGKRLKVFKHLSSSLWSILNDYKSKNLKTYKTNLTWRDIYLTFNYLTYDADRHKSLPAAKEELTTYGHTMLPIGKFIEDEWNFNTLIFKNMYQMLPLFSFYIYKVDKKVFKNTRGKSGKFTFIWKYITPYKRLFLVMHWLLKELRIKPGRSMADRLGATLQALCLSPKKTWMWKVRKFSHNYVYRNSRKTLAESYRTVTK